MWQAERRSVPRMDKLEKCNLFIRRGYRGFQEMLDAFNSKQIDHLRWDDTGRDGIHVNHTEYGRIVGYLNRRV